MLNPIPQRIITHMKNNDIYGMVTNLLVHNIIISNSKFDNLFSLIFFQINFQKSLSMFMFAENFIRHIFVTCFPAKAEASKSSDSLTVMKVMKSSSDSKTEATGSGGKTSSKSGSAAGAAATSLSKSASSAGTTSTAGSKSMSKDRAEAAAFLKVIRMLLTVFQAIVHGHC